MVYIIDLTVLIEYGQMN